MVGPTPVGPTASRSGAVSSAKAFHLLLCLLFLANRLIANRSVVSSAMPSSFTLRPVWLSWMIRVGGL